MKKTFLLPLFAALFLGACETKLPPGTIKREYPSQAITQILLRGCNADAASVREKGGPGSPIVIKGLVSGGEAGSQKRDKDWHGSPAAQWGLDFISRQHGDTLVISTMNETSFETHRYVLENIELDVPRSMKVVSELRPPTKDGVPDLSPP